MRIDVHSVRTMNETELKSLMNVNEIEMILFFQFDVKIDRPRIPRINLDQRVKLFINLDGIIHCVFN